MSIPKAKKYISDFEKLGFGMFIHFGLYSILGKGEWALKLLEINSFEYEKLIKKFNPSKNQVKNLVATAKKAGCKYINIKARHYDGFSLFDTLGLDDYNAPHSACGRDLIK